MPRLNHGPGLSCLALVIDALGGTGGIAQYNRDFFAVLAAPPIFATMTILPRNPGASIGIPERMIQAHPRPAGYATPSAPSPRRSNNGQSRVLRSRPSRASRGCNCPPHSCPAHRPDARDRGLARAVAVATPRGRIGRSGAKRLASHARRGTRLGRYTSRTGDRRAEHNRRSLQTG